MNQENKKEQQKYNLHPAKISIFFIIKNKAGKEKDKQPAAVN